MSDTRLCDSCNIRPGHSFAGKTRKFVCKTCYARWWRHGRFSRIRRPLQCTELGCTEPHYSKGRCSQHYNQHYNNTRRYLLGYGSHRA